MQSLKNHPKLGHITTFGGHPVIAAAGLATIKTLLAENLMTSALEKEKLFRSLLKHRAIKEIRGRGLMLALMLDDPELVNKIIINGMKKGIVLFWLLFEPKAIRITPPLNISNDEIKKGCDLILSLLDEYDNKL